MSDSVTGHICFGVVLQTDDGDPAEPPWKEAGCDSEETWWLQVSGYQPSVRIYNDEGRYVDGKEPARETLERYYGERRLWLQQHPLPFQVVRVGSEELPYLILAVPGSAQICGRWEPTAFDLSSLTLPESPLAAFHEFCRQYGISHAPRWQLACFAP